MPRSVIGVRVHSVVSLDGALSATHLSKFSIELFNLSHPANNSSIVGRPRTTTKLNFISNREEKFREPEELGVTEYSASKVLIDQLGVNHRVQVSKKTRYASDCTSFLLEVGGCFLIALDDRRNSLGSCNRCVHDKIWV